MVRQINVGEKSWKASEPEDNNSISLLIAAESTCGLTRQGGCFLPCSGGSVVARLKVWWLPEAGSPPLCSDRSLTMSYGFISLSAFVFPAALFTFSVHLPCSQTPVFWFRELNWWNFVFKTANGKTTLSHHHHPAFIWQRHSPVWPPAAQDLGTRGWRWAETPQLALPLEQLFLGQLLPLPARLKLTHCASDLTQSVCTWNLTCFSSSRFPCRDKNCFTHGLIKGRLCFQSLPFSVSEMFSERICWPQFGFQKRKFLWFMPCSFWSPIQTEVCRSSSLCNPQQA